MGPAQQPSSVAEVQETDSYCLRWLIVTPSFRVRHGKKDGDDLGAFSRVQRQGRERVEFAFSAATAAATTTVVGLVLSNVLGGCFLRRSLKVVRSLDPLDCSSSSRPRKSIPDD